MIETKFSGFWFVAKIAVERNIFVDVVDFEYSNFQ